MPLASFSASSRCITARLSSGALAAALVVIGATLGYAPAADARGGGGPKAESQAPKHAAHGAVKSKHAERQERIAVPSGPLPVTVMAALARAHVPLSSMSVVVQRIGAPVPLVAINATQPMLPASTMKLVTTYAGLSLLGPDYRWKTTAYADGEVDTQGVLHGNLYIQGTGDPKLVPEELIDLVDQIRRNGITGIDGALVLDKRYFDPSTRDLPAFDNDDSAPYNVGPDPLLYAFKSLSFTLTPNPDGQVSIDVLPQLAQLQIDNELRVTRGACAGSLPAASPSVAQTTGGFVQASFIGDYPLRCGSRTINVAALDHSTFFAGGFLALWKQTGGTFNGATREGATPSGARLVGTHRSPVLADIVRDINKFSNNVMARNLFLTIGAATAKAARDDRQVRAGDPVVPAPQRAADAGPRARQRLRPLARRNTSARSRSPICCKPRIRARSRRCSPNRCRSRASTARCATVSPTRARSATRTSRPAPCATCGPSPATWVRGTARPMSS